LSTAPQDKDQLPQAQAGVGERYRVDARGAEGLLVGDKGTQINYFYKGTWTDGVAPAPLVSMSGTITSPYRGLSAFGERDAALFFGRESAATEVLERMSQRLEGTGLVVVSGVSGAGKSSLLRAGVLPRLRGAGLGSVPEAASWPRLVFTPGREPLEQLAVRVAPVAGADAAAVLPGLVRDPAGFALTARQAALAHLGTPAQDGGLPDEAGQRRVLLVVDQFEQVFTQCKDKDKRQKFITALHAAAATVGDENQLPAAVVVLLVRADFEAHLADYPLLVSSVQDRYLLTAMTERQLRMAITQPAVTAGSSVDEDLVQVLLEEVRTRSGSAGAGSGGAAIGAGVLPLLSHALDQAWRGRAGHALTLADYERTGGIEGAVAASAERAYDRLTPAQQAMARQVFTRLTATTSDGVDTAARATRADLTVGKDDVQVRDVEAVLETFTAERLLTLAAGTVEISHEALLTAWPLLRDTWLAETHADRVIRTRLQATAEEWNNASRDPSYLYSGSRLEIAAEAAARIDADARQAPLGQAEEDFLHASRRANQRRTRRRQGFTATLLALVLGLAVVSVAAVHASQIATQQRDTATQQRDVAIAGELASESEAIGDTNATVSQLKSIAAWGIDASDQARYAMLTAAASPEIATFTAGTGPVWSVAFSPDGKTLATGDTDGTAGLWDVATGRQTGGVAGGFGVGTLAFGPGGKTLATGQENGARLWDVATGQLIRSVTPTDTAGVGVTVAFSPDGKTLASNDGNGTSGLWSLATGQQIRSLITDDADNSFRAMAFSPDSKLLATSDQEYGTVSLWNVATGQQIRSFLVGSPADTIDSVAFSPDGKTLATGDIDGTADLWNVATGKQIRSFSTSSGEINSVAFGPDGKTLATAGTDGTELWNLATGSQIGTPFTGLGPVDSVAFSPDGKTLATGDDDGTVRMWDVAADRQIGSFPVTTNSVGPDAWAAFSPDDKTLATTGADGTALWNAATGRQIRSLPADLGAVDSVAFSPDGKTLATGEADGTGLWNVTTGRQVGRLPVGNDDTAYSVFSPDGKTLATVVGISGEASSTAQLWNVATGRQIRSFPIDTGVFSVALSPDGNTLAIGEAGSTELWNVTTGQQISSLGQPTGSIYVPDDIWSVAFSPDGKTLATGDADGTVKLWKVATGQQISSFPTGSDTVFSVAFSPDGKTLATGDDDDTARLWNLATLQQIGSPLPGSGPVQAVTFSPDGRTLATDDGTVQLWNVGYLVDVLTRLCSQVGGSLTQAEWTQDVPSGPRYRNVCAQHS